MSDASSAARPPLPPFDAISARHKVQAAEDAWNTRDPEQVAAAYSHDSIWRNRDQFVVGHDQIVAFEPAQRRIRGPRTASEAAQPLALR